MPHLIYPLDADLFAHELAPALARSWRERSFEPCRAACVLWLPKVQAYHADYHGLAEPTLVEQAAQGLTFDRHTWRALVGEMLVLAAVEVPLLQIPVATLCCLLTGDTHEPRREEFQPIHCALFGGRDIVLGTGYYRPSEAGYNLVSEVVTLSHYLQSINTQAWRPDALTSMAELADEDDRAEEIAFARQTWGSLVGVYQRAAAAGHLVVCERV